MSVGMLALKLAVSGIGTVFVILGVLGLMMHCFKYVFDRSKQAEAGTASGLPGDLPAGEEKEEELVAVFAAASYYARLMYKRPVLVKAVTPVWDAGHESIWQATGRRELLSSRLDLRGVK
jgi:Na+-transporting methylmalonyl-CoA/oxaloacetate decarboxylase gamma subunit